MPITIADVAARAKVSKTTVSRALDGKGELTWPWIGEVVQDAVDVLETERYGLLLFTCNRGDESMRQFGAQVSAKSFDGLRVIEPEGTLDYIATLHARGLPVVLIDDHTGNVHGPRLHRGSITDIAPTLPRAPLSPDFRNT